MNLTMILRLSVLILASQFTVSQAHSADLLSYFTKFQRRKINIYSNLSVNSMDLSTNNSALTIVAPETGGEIFLNEKWSMSASYFFSVSVDFDSEISGLDMGTRYYYLKPGYKHQASILNSSIETSPDFSPFIYMVGLIFKATSI